jgi:hypothetical protein
MAALPVGVLICDQRCAGHAVGWGLNLGTRGGFDGTMKESKTTCIDARMTILSGR